MERIALLFPALITVSVFFVIVAFFFLQSRAQGLARVLILTGGLFVVFSTLYIMGIGKNQDAMVRILIASGGVNAGTILLSIGVILFSISLPSKRLRLKAEDRRVLSDKIIQDMLNQK